MNEIGNYSFEFYPIGSKGTPVDTANTSKFDEEFYKDEKAYLSFIEKEEEMKKDIENLKQENLKLKSEIALYNENIIKENENKININNLKIENEKNVENLKIDIERLKCELERALKMNEKIKIENLNETLSFKKSFSSKNESKIDMNFVKANADLLKIKKKNIAKDKDSFCKTSTKK